MECDASVHAAHVRSGTAVTSLEPEGDYLHPGFESGFESGCRSLSWQQLGNSASQSAYVAASVGETKHTGSD
jgi:hypothetical protein